MNKKTVSWAASVMMAGSLAAAPFAGAQTMGGQQGTMQGGMPQPTVMGGQMPGGTSGRMEASGQGMMMGQGGGMGQPMMGMGGQQGGGMGEHPMVMAMEDVAAILDDGSLAPICGSSAGAECFPKLSAAAKRTSKTYKTLTAALDALEDEGAIESMQMVLDFIRKIPSASAFTGMLAVADAMDAGDPEAASQALAGISAKKGTAFSTMLQEMKSQVAMSATDLSEREAQTEERSKNEQDFRKQMSEANKQMDKQRQEMMLSGMKGGMGAMQPGSMGMNGSSVNGMPMNGMMSNGMGMNGMSANGMGGQNGQMMGGSMGMQGGMGMPKTADEAAKMYEQTNPGKTYTPEMREQFNSMQRSGGMMQPGSMGMNGQNGQMMGGMNGGMQGQMNGMMQPTMNGVQPGMGGQMGQGGPMMGGMNGGMMQPPMMMGGMQSGGMMPPPGGQMMPPPQGGMGMPPPGGATPPPPPPTASAIGALGMGFWRGFFNFLGF